jgi:D-alanyl-lipoteichoic acid acyltransferase DltB (MBOAT superfamily)
MQLIIAIFVYTMQIYCDFSGGIDITRGVAEVMGIDLIENFQRPYFANSVGDYWSRWHMSLTGWMRDYVFFPMTLSKRMLKVGSWGRAHIKGRIGKQLPSYCVTFTVFFLIGIWHGASAGHLMFAFYNGFIIVLGMICKPLFDWLGKLLCVDVKSFGFKVWTILRTYCVMVVGKVIVKAVNVPAAFYMLRMCLTDFMHFGRIRSRLNAMGMGGYDWLILMASILLLFTISVLQENGIVIRDRLESRPLVVRWIIYFVIIIFLMVFGIYGPGYDATEFIYRAY